MLIKHKQLIGLLVETQSGEKLGRVDGFNLESEAHAIHQYLVKLFISRAQVISLSAEKMVVDDLVYKALAENNKERRQKTALAAEGATASES